MAWVVDQIKVPSPLGNKKKSRKKLLPSKYEPLTKIQYNLILTKNQLSFYVNYHEVPTKTLLASN
jgi:hypothetical protein